MLCIMNVGAVTESCISNVGTAPTFIPSLLWKRSIVTVLFYNTKYEVNALTGWDFIFSSWQRLFFMKDFG